MAARVSRRKMLTPTVSQISAGTAHPVKPKRI